LTSGIGDQLQSLPGLRDAVIPVTRPQWESALADARVFERTQSITSGIDALLLAAREEDGARAARDLRVASTDVAETLRKLLSDLGLLSSLLPAQMGGVERLRDAITELAGAGLAAATGREPQDLDPAHGNRAAAALVELREPGGLVDDQVEAALGMALSEVRDARGVFSAARLLGAYRGRYEDLQDRVYRLLGPITDEPPDLINALHPAEALVVSSRPLLTLRAATAVREILEDALGTTGSNLTPLRDLKLRVGRSAASHAGIIETGRALNRAEEAGDEAEQARLMLDLYRRMVEGQLRPWAWTLLQVCGRTAPRTPELASVQDQLIADGRPLFRDIAAAVLPVARNAAAHEDYAWDDEARTLAVGDDCVTVAALEDATERAYSLMCGAECAWACMRSASIDFASFLDASDPKEGLGPIDERSALAHFGTNGLLPSDARLARGTWSVTLDELPFHRINPCFQALVWSAQILRRAHRFQVWLPSRELPVMDIQRHVLEANWMVWCQARATMEAMPQSAFLPVNAWTRLAVELPEASAQAAAWLALNDAIDACNESESLEHPAGPPTDPAAIRCRAARLTLRLDVVVAAVGATLTVLPVPDNRPLEQVLAVVEPAAHWAASTAVGHTPGPLPAYIDQLHELFDARSAVAVLPTLDPTPLDQVA